MKYAPYSFSKIGTFKQCPKKFEYAYIQKIKIDDVYVDPIFFKRGKFIHNYIADRLSGGSGEINGFNQIKPDDKMNLIDKAEDLLTHEYLTMSYNFEETGIERCIKLNESLNFSNKKNHTIIGYIDYYAVNDDIGIVVDWKSGKLRNEPNFKQLELYSIWLLSKYPNLKEIDMVFGFIEHNQLRIKTISRDDLLELKESLKTDINSIESTEIFDIQPNKYCPDCQFFETCNSEHNLKELF